MSTAASPLIEKNALTPDQVQFFDDYGYLILRDRIPADLITSLQEATDAWIDRGHKLFDQGELLPGRPPGWENTDNADFHFAHREGTDVMFRVDYVHSKGYAASLELLGCPEMLGIAESLCGPNFVPTYESLVFKQAGDGAPIAWHQDSVHPRTHRIFNVDVYLDHSLPGQGALRVVPGSQTNKIDACQIADDHGWDPPGAIEVEMAPGDVLVHDTMLVHGSPAVTGNQLRRTIYYEFRPAEQIVLEGPWDRAWIDARLRLIPLALQAHRARTGDERPWNVSDEFRPVPAGDDEAELRVVHTVNMPGSYCSAGSVT